MYRAKTEFIVNLDKFRNSELFQPGIYFLKFSLFHEDSERVYYGKPQLLETQGDDQVQDSRQRNRLTLFHDLVEPKVIEDEASVASKTFLIRYADESVKLGNMIKFETEVDLRSLHRS